MNINLQPILQNEFILMQPLQPSDFEDLFKVASDPLIWEQHPNKNRYQRQPFQIYFEGAMQSNGALLITDKATNEIIGCSRFYDYNQEKKSVFIGYTFIARKFWGKGYNPAMKELMMNYAFQFVDSILFHIGANNFRSQIAIGKVGAIKRKEIKVAYHGEPSQDNFEYELTRENWEERITAAFKKNNENQLLNL